MPESFIHPAEDEMDRSMKPHPQLREKTFANFAVLGAWPPLARQKRAIRFSAKIVFFTTIFADKRYIIPASTAKVFSLQSFPLYFTFSGKM